MGRVVIKPGRGLYGIPCKGDPDPMLEKLRDEIELIQRHLLVARAVADHEPIGIIRLSEVLGLPQHRIRYSLRILEQMGYIRPSPLGASASPEMREMLRAVPEELDAFIRTLQEMKKSQIQDGQMNNL